MKTIIAIFLVLTSTASFAAPSKIGFQGFSSAGVTNYATTCTISGVVKEGDGTERIVAASMRTFAMNKNGFKNYSTSVFDTIADTAGYPRMYKVNCVKTVTGEAWQTKMFFDGDQAVYFPISSAVFKLQ